jgi:hypothetical protein
MQVEFRKTGERRYAVKIRREGLPDLEMNPAPGFDELMPHDLLHFLVEQEFGLQNAIYGQLERGGTAGTFHQVSDEKSDKRAASRQRRKTAKRGEKMLKTSLDEYAKSERATYICMYEWFSDSADEKLKIRAREMKPSIESTYAQMTEAERKNYTKEKLSEIRNRMSELSEKWSNLKINESIYLEW